MYIVLGIMLVGILMVCVFVLGGLFARHLIYDSLDEARQQRVSEEYYRLAGYRQAGDPKPYIPPTVRPKAPKSRYIPHMSTLDRLLHEGRRGTIMVRAGDRRKKDRAS